jgi:hypothetical protein
MDSFIEAIVATDNAARRSTQLQIIDNLIKVCDQVLAETSIGVIPSDFKEGRWSVAEEFKNGLETAKAQILAKV